MCAAYVRTTELPSNAAASPAPGGFQARARRGQPRAISRVRLQRERLLAFTWPFVGIRGIRAANSSNESRTREDPIAPLRAVVWRVPDWQCLGSRQNGKRRVRLAVIDPFALSPRSFRDLESAARHGSTPITPHAIGAGRGGPLTPRRRSRARGSPAYGPGRKPPHRTLQASLAQRPGSPLRPKPARPPGRWVTVLETSRFD